MNSQPTTSLPLAAAITGASGAIYAIRLLEALSAAGCDVHLSISPAGQAVLKHELGLNVDLQDFHPRQLLSDAAQVAADEKLQAMRRLAGVGGEGSHVLEAPSRQPGRLIYHHFQDLMAPIASGSFRTRGMVICPCSGGTLSGIAHGASANLIQRAAEVHLKERRTLVLMPRETPLSLVTIDNYRRCAEAGAVLLPAMPGFYHDPLSMGDLVDFVVARICDQFQIEHSLMRRWGEPSEGAD